MARGLKVIDIVALPAGGKEIIFAWGPSTTPPANATGSKVFATDDELREFIRAFEDGMDEAHMLALHLGLTYLGQDGSFKNPVQVKNKTLQLDIFAAAPIKVV